MRIHRATAIAFAFLALNILTLDVLYAQTSGGSTSTTPQVQTIAPEDLTNRQLSYFNDASAVGWNPSLLGLAADLEDYDVVLGVPYLADNYSLSKSLYAGFAKLGPLAVGTLGTLDSTSTYSQKYFGGLGFPMFDRHAAFGLSAQFDGGKAFFKSAQYTIAATVWPTDHVLGSATIENIFANDDAIRLSLNGAWLPLDWFMLTGGIRFDKRDTIIGGESWSVTPGIVLSLSDPNVVASAGYDVVGGVAHLGLEIAFAKVSGGSLNNVTSAGYRGGVALLRVNSGGPLRVTDRSTIYHTDPRGWAPDRAYSPAELHYEGEYHDAGRMEDNLVRNCQYGGPTFDTPAEIVSSLRSNEAWYPGLAEQLQSIAPDPSNLYKAIRSRYYSAGVHSSELQSGDSLAIVARGGYSIGVQSVDQSQFPRVRVNLQVTDAQGHNVAGLGKDDFSFRDSTLHIVSVRPSDASQSVPVDVVMMIDCSGSMGNEIASVLANARQFVETMKQRGADYRIGGVLYGSMIYDTLHPTSDFDRFEDFLKPAKAIGGDEISTLAIKAATQMPFRPNAQRVFVLVTDDWVVQDNAPITESDLVHMLWDTRARLFTILDPCKDNNALATRLSLGREYDVTAPFNDILDQIGSDITTTYELVYESRMPERITLLQGRAHDSEGNPVGTDLHFHLLNGTSFTVKTSPTTGEYETRVKEGIVYGVTAGGDVYLPIDEQVDLSKVEAGAVVHRDFTFERPQTTIAGVLKDENGKPVAGEVRIEDDSTLERLATVKTDESGHYQTQINEGKAYRMTAVAPSMMPAAVDRDLTGVKRGEHLKQDFDLVSIQTAIDRGTAFTLRNIFFDFDKWDLKPESLPEINRLVELMNEYPSVRVEIGAHTDSRGSDSYNQELSAKRAQSVVDYLVSRGISRQRLEARGYGESKPIATNDTDEGRALNRRVEFKLIR